MTIALWVMAGMAANTLGMWGAGFIGGFIASFTGIDNIKAGVFLGFLVYCVVMTVGLAVALT